jgi:hypothetical protein
MRKVSVLGITIWPGEMAPRVQRGIARASIRTDVPQSVASWMIRIFSRGSRWRTPG